MLFNTIEFIQDNLDHFKVELIHKYIKMVMHWNKTTNITSKHCIKSRLYNFVCESIAMSYLLSKENFIQSDINIADIGSGAGFPGIILSILGFNVFLIEKNIKKAVFLQYTIAELNLKAIVCNQNALNVKLNNIHYITSKALKDVSNICHNIQSADTIFILCQNAQDNAKTVSLVDRYNHKKQYSFVQL